MSPFLTGGVSCDTTRYSAFPVLPALPDHRGSCPQTQPLLPTSVNLRSSDAPIPCGRGLDIFHVPPKQLVLLRAGCPARHHWACSFCCSTGLRRRNTTRHYYRSRCERYLVVPPEPSVAHRPLSTAERPWPRPRTLRPPFVIRPGPVSLGWTRLRTASRHTEFAALGGACRAGPCGADPTLVVRPISRLPTEAPSRG
jgi:hypothetical protein